MHQWCLVCSDVFGVEMQEENLLNIFPDLFALIK